MVVTRELRDVSVTARRDVSYEIGPFITLVDGPDFELYWAERKNLILGQIQGADLVAVSRVDLMSQQSLEEVMHLLQEHTKNLFALSTRDGMGVDTVIAALG